ncbi:MAG: lytic transglycosylase domain-containing protein [Pseudomonadota bacterium]
MIRTIVAATAALTLGLVAPSDQVGPMRAQAQDQSTDFTFKRVRAPRPGAAKRITVQIGTTATSATPAPRPRRAARFGFFWKAVPAEQDFTPAARLALAVATIQAAHADGRPVLGPSTRLREIIETFGPEIDRAARRTGVSAAFIASVILIESAGRPTAKSPKDAQGLMQLIPATARRFGVADPYDPAQNIAGGAAYLDLLLDLFDQDPLLALAGYNAGENAVLRSKGVPNYRETRDYVPLVIAAWLQARDLCVTPPQTPRMPCDLGLGPRIPPGIGVHRPS